MTISTRNQVYVSFRPEELDVVKQAAKVDYAYGELPVSVFIRNHMVKYSEKLLAERSEDDSR